MRPHALATGRRSRPSFGVRSRTIALWVFGVFLCATLLLSPAAVAAPPAPTPGPVSVSASARWVWPGGIAVVARAYDPPSHAYGAGHRGVDVAVTGDAVVAPDDGVVAFRGTVVDRPLITIDHGDGLVSTLEPVDSALAAGQPVVRGMQVGTIDSGGHASPGTLHLGARLDGEYINPLALLGAIERPVLLPCCTA